MKKLIFFATAAIILLTGCKQKETSFDPKLPNVFVKNLFNGEIVGLNISPNDSVTGYDNGDTILRSYDRSTGKHGFRKSDPSAVNMTEGSMVSHSGHVWYIKCILLSGGKGMTDNPNDPQDKMDSVKTIPSVSFN